VSAALTLLAVIFLTRAASSTPVSNTVIDQTGVGLGMAVGGVGLFNLGAGSRDFDVVLPAGVGKDQVQSAHLFWAGRFLLSSVDADADQVLNFEGTNIVGVSTGSEIGFGNNVGYRADVTTLFKDNMVGTGTQTVTIADGDTTAAKNLPDLNGAGLVVIYTDPAETGTFRVIVKDGLDFAYNGFAGTAAGETAPVTFNFTAFGAASNAQLAIFAGDAEPVRPDRITVTGVGNIDFALDSTEGEQFDVERINVPIGAAQTSITAQLFSTPLAGTTADPDSLLWLLGAVRVPVFVETPPPPGNGATRTQGYWSTHLAALTAAVNAGCIDLGVLAVVPSGTQDLNDATIGEAMAIMHAKIGKDTTALGQARLQLAQQLIAAFANECYLGSTTESKGFSATLLEDAVAALDGTDVDLIKSFIGLVTGFNESGDAVNAPSLAQFGNADPKAAKDAANSSPGAAFN
jgi:hypothetical protein